MTKTRDDTACHTCGTIEKSGRLSCCGRGGAWFQKCGGAGNAKFEHTWSEGVQACHTWEQSKTIMGGQQSNSGRWPSGTTIVETHTATTVLTKASTTALHDTYPLSNADRATLFYSTPAAATTTAAITDWVSPGMHKMYAYVCHLPRKILNTLKVQTALLVGSLEVGIIVACVVFVLIILSAMTACFFMHKNSIAKKGSPTLPGQTDCGIVKESKKNNLEYEHTPH